MRYVASLEVPRPIDEVFDYLARFSLAAEWDPGVAEAAQVTDDPVGLGSRFRLVAVFLGNRVPLTYEIVEYDRPNRVVLEASTSSAHSLDAITFEAVAGGTRITYDALLEFKGLFRPLSPLLAAAFRRIGDAATKGLATALPSVGSEG